MTMWFTGENSYQVQQAVKSAVAAFDGTAERVDGTTLELKNLPDLLMGATLFAQKRLVIIKDLSQNPSIWQKLPEWIDRISDDITLILIDSKPDKRTTLYKEVKKRVTTKEFPLWGERDQPLAQSWVVDYAEQQDVTLDTKIARHIVGRVGLDQWELANAVDKVLLLDTITIEAIDITIDPTPSENVFLLFELALDGRRAAVHDMIRTLELTEEPYKLFALLSSQAFQLAGVASSTASNNPSKELAIHPFVASKLARHGKRLGPRGAARILSAFAKGDADMKISRGDPWLLIEKALVATSL